MTNDDTNGGDITEHETPPGFDDRVRALLIEVATADTDMSDDDRRAYAELVHSQPLHHAAATDPDGVQWLASWIDVDDGQPFVARLRLDQLDVIATPNGIVAL